MNNLEKMIHSAKNKNASVFKKTFANELSDRIGSKFESMKQSLAQTMFVKESNFEFYDFLEEDWNNLSEDEKIELEEGANGRVVWTMNDDDEDDEVEVFEDEDEDEDEDDEDDDEDDDDIDEAKRYAARNTMKRRKTQLVKDRGKFKNRQKKLKAKIERKKGGVKVKRLKLRKKWIRRNKSKIKNAQRVYGGKVKSKYTKK